MALAGSPASGSHTGYNQDMNHQGGTEEGPASSSLRGGWQDSGPWGQLD